MLHRNARLLLTAAAAAVVVLTGRASTAVFWQVATRVEFLKGDVDSLSIDNDGRVSLGPATTQLYDTGTPFVWSLVTGTDGVVYAGTGNEGKVFRVSPDGQASLFYDAGELAVHALAVAPGGGLYAAASPDGRIYKVDAKGQAAPFYDPDDKYIWSLAVDATGNVFAGTGEKGVIYKIAPDGKGAVFYRTRAGAVLSLSFDRSGNLLAATESPGRVFRIDPAGKGFVLLDSPYREIHQLRLDEQGVIYATAVNGSKDGTEAPATELSVPEPSKTAAPVPTVTTEITSISVLDIGSTMGEKPATPRALRAAKGAVYRITPDGVWDTVWESQEDTPYDLALDGKGGVIIGTGTKGKIFHVAGDPPRITLVGRADAQQVTRFLPTAGAEMYYATSNPGKLFRLSARRAARGTIDSEVRDATTVSSWGTISWRATTPTGSSVEVRTRSGNSDKPDETWSDWSDPYRNAEGEQVRSPKARYLQWRAILTAKDASPVLTSVTAAYLQRNLRPKVTGITVYPSGIVFQKPFSTGEAELAGFEDGWPDTRPSPAALAAGTAVVPPSQGPTLGRRTYQKGLQAFSWKAEDDNDDKLQYDVLFRRETDTTWKAVRRGVTDQLFVWDTTSVPNGTYLVKVVASDAPSNPPGSALTGEADSTTFDVDNTPPVVRFTGVRAEGGKTIVSFEVRDEHSAVQRVDSSSDANRWRPIYPKDGICDSRVEQFELVVEGDPSNVVIRAIDAMTNVATGRANGEASKGQPNVR